MIIVHFGTNDITAGKDTDKNTQKKSSIWLRLSHRIQKLQFPSVLSEKTSKALQKKWIRTTPFYEKLPQGTTCI